MESARPYKPQMRSLLSFSDIPITSIVSPKLDGEFNLIVHTQVETYTLNLWDTMQYQLPCIRECRQALLAKGITQAKLLAELYGVDKSGRMLRLPEFIHEVKAGDKNRVKLGVFDLIEVNKLPISEGYRWKLEEIADWFQNAERVHVIPHGIATSQEALKQFWSEWVEEGGYEGLVAYNNGGWFKVKKRTTIDAVIVGINKKPRYEIQEVTSLKIAVMDEHGQLIEVGDVASGIDHPLRKELWKLTDYKLREDRETLYIKPIVVVEVEFTETFEAEKPVYTFTDDHLHQVGARPYYSLRHPRLTRFRPDKTPTKQDIPLEQLGGS